MLDAIKIMDMKAAAGNGGQNGPSTYAPARIGELEYQEFHALITELLAIRKDTAPENVRVERARACLEKRRLTDSASLLSAVEELVCAVNVRARKVLGTAPYLSPEDTPTFFEVHREMMLAPQR
jgi:hypothetical protein